MDPNDWHFGREKVRNELNQQSGQHLVVLRYGQRHDPTHEWVYNKADIDRAKIVWAQEMDPDHNGKLLRYFRGRRIWLLMVDDAGYQLTEVQNP